MPVSCSESAVPIYPVGRGGVLTRTITLGYPRIATTDAPYLLAHGGELNAVVSNYYGEERLIISNAVAPGNSGGPVLDEAVLCIGMVINAFETTHDGGVVPPTPRSLKRNFELHRTFPDGAYSGIIGLLARTPAPFATNPLIFQCPFSSRPVRHS
jgi:hypothetical protein